MEAIGYRRWLLKSILQGLKVRRVISLEGPRQCGKTTLAKNLDLTKIYRTLDDIGLLEYAKIDPQSFIKHNDELMIIDEIQRAPELLLAIKKDVDVNLNPGRFLITGSANIQALPSVRESLAGRIKKIRLRPLATGEIKGTPPNFLSRAFNKEFRLITGISNYDKDAYLELAFKGGYPEAVLLQENRYVKSWHNDYITSLIERDLKDILNLYRKEALKKMLEILASWSSKFMDITKITSHLSIARNTAESYINALETLYLVERLNPWTNTDYDRVGKQDKLFFADSGLMASILNWTIEDVRLDGEQNGKLLETYVFNQLAAIIDANDNNYKLYHYRDRHKREIDFIIEDEKSNILAIEVKAGSAITKASFKHIEWFRANMAKKECIGIILYTGEHILSFGDDLLALPISYLFTP